MPEVTGTILDQIAAAVLRRHGQIFAAFDADGFELVTRPVPLGVECLLKNGFGIIAEIKSGSPTLGRIDDPLSLSERVQAYAKGGASAISVLTEPDYFLGDLTRLDQVRLLTDLPLLRKDFIIHPQMVNEAYNHGADWILLIAAILNDAELEQLLELCKRLGLTALLEVHNQHELDRVLPLSPHIIGINNRNLKTFHVSLQTSMELKRFIPAHIPVIAESGIRSLEDVQQLRQAGFAGVLVGETLMRSPDPASLLQEWLS